MTPSKANPTMVRAAAVALAAVALTATTTPAQAQIDGHGPDAWRVTGVSSRDVLNARMGPGANYPVIETFAHNERALKQVTCVPLYTPARYAAMTPAQIKALPPRWCLMRNAAMSKAGWVAQQFITPDGATPAPPSATRPSPASPSARPGPPSGGVVAEAQSLVRNLYDAQARSEQGRGVDPLRGPAAARYFTADIVKFLNSGRAGAHPLYGAQDFDGRVTRIQADAAQPMLRGMITINVDFTNFGKPQRAVYFLRADTAQRGAPLRIFRVEHRGWSYP